ncbi:MAG TPA: hypothetical protein VJS38_06060 [Phenylobacterium sp.]|uniref:hypothetical protein n=1 Tax=Phenylobacterium sp. TaxID=1871053 RepID=UPI002B4A15E0|nr:hypothetical protein [Phenylobacterium sp.]HKR87722.1 hypothetical protein [Phenylobacterium sp.]
MGQKEQERLHRAMGYLGLRAPATAAGLLQLTAELVKAGVLEREAADRVKDAMACDLVMSRPRTAWKDEFEVSVRRELDRLFEGDLGPKA